MKRNELPTYGMDVEIKARERRHVVKERKQLESKYDRVMEQQARDWIATVTGEPFPEGSFQEGLKSGVLLCKLVNKLKPGAIAKVNNSAVAFMQMENIKNFLEFGYSIGVTKEDTFQTIDLYEAQNLQQVIVGIHALSRVAGAKGLTTHVIGPKMATPNPRNFDEEVMNAGKNVPSQQLGSNQFATQAGLIYGRRRQIDETPFIH